MNWREYLQSNFSYGGEGDLIENAFEMEAYDRAKSDNPVISFKSAQEYEKPLRDKKTFEELKNTVENLILTQCSSVVKFDSYSSCSYSGFDFYVEVVKVKSNTNTLVRYRILSFNYELFDEINSVFEKSLNLNPPKNASVYMLTSVGGRLNLQRLGSFKSKLNENNYSTEVLDGFNKITKNVKSESPNGRLSIIYGPPGTGKTYLLRSVINDVSDGIFISAQPEVFRRYSSSDIISCISGLNSERTVLLVEDADSILQSRESNSLDIVSNILNLTDGFFGEASNLHLICTTNMEELSIDKAFLRKGRISQRVHVKELDTSDAKKAYEALGGDPDKIAEPTVLADLYGKIND